MPEDTGLVSLTVNATAMRPLLGLTVLVIEDSRYASEAVRLLCIRSGARIRRADSLAAADKHLRTYRPSVVIVDMGLPDGSGEELISRLAHEDMVVRPVILATSGADGAVKAKAIAAGADDFFAKPIESVSAFQQIILDHLPPDMRPLGPRPVSNETVTPDPFALSEDLTHLDSLLESGVDTLPYVAPFFQGLARLAGDNDLRTVADRLKNALDQGTGRKAAISDAQMAIRARIALQAAI